MADTTKKLRRQLEFYFGDSNFRRDNFMRETAEQDDGYITIETLLTFPRLKAISTDPEAICNAISESPVVECDEGRTKLRRKQPLPEVDTSKDRTVYAKGFPKETTLDELLDYFEELGHISAVRMRRFRDKQFKGSVTVEFLTKEDAEKAIQSGLTFKDTPLTQVCWMADWEQEEIDRKQRREQEEEERSLQAMEKNVFIAVSYTVEQEGKEEKEEEEQSSSSSSLSFHQVKDSMHAFIDTAYESKAAEEEQDEQKPVVKFVDLSLDMTSIFPDLASDEETTTTTTTNGWFMVRCRSSEQRNTLVSLLNKALEDAEEKKVVLSDFTITSIRSLEGENEEAYLKKMLKTKRVKHDQPFRKNKRARR